MSCRSLIEMIALLMNQPFWWPFPSFQNNRTCSSMPLFLIHLFLTCPHFLFSPSVRLPRSVWLHQQLTLMMFASRGRDTSLSSRQPSSACSLFPSLFIYAGSPLPSRCILILMAVWCKFIEVQRERERETLNVSIWWDGGGETMIDWENTRDNQRERTRGWGTDGGRRKRREINMALIVSSAPPLSLHQPFITPPQSVQRRHFGKWGPRLAPSVKTAATHVGVCFIPRIRQIICVWTFDRVYVNIQRNDDMCVCVFSP